ncbi:MAG: hypothetical protein WBE48_19910 [Xanthobacteraceae bacterium]
MLLQYSQNAVAQSQNGIHAGWVTLFDGNNLVGSWTRTVSLSPTAATAFWC